VLYYSLPPLTTTQVQEALRLGRRALAERNELARRLRDTHDELQVQIAMGTAEGGHLHVEQLKAVTGIMGPTPADPEAATPAESVVDEEAEDLEHAPSHASGASARSGSVREGAVSGPAVARGVVGAQRAGRGVVGAQRAGRALEAGDFEALQEVIDDGEQQHEAAISERRQRSYGSFHVSRR